MTEKIKKTRGGARAGAGRKALHKKLSNYNKAISLLDENIITAIDVLIKGLNSRSVNFRLRSAELLLKKSLPDKTSIEFDKPRNLLLDKLSEYKPSENDE